MTITKNMTTLRDWTPKKAHRFAVSRLEKIQHLWLVYFIDHEARTVRAACCDTARAAAAKLRPGLAIRKVEVARP